MISCYVHITAEMNMKVWTLDKCMHNIISDIRGAVHVLIDVHALPLPRDLMYNNYNIFDGYIIAEYNTNY